MRVAINMGPLSSVSRHRRSTSIVSRGSYTCDAEGQLYDAAGSELLAQGKIYYPRLVPKWMR